ncbi:MAG: hypothetical protein MAG431_00452 [Chloroflexi bacterium]|nr:hypothetical protein [Chloroflexota bacterium]
MTTNVKVYLNRLRDRFKTGQATEYSHGSALEELLESLADGVQAINDPKRVECGAPDFIILRGKTPIGYVETKDIDTGLHHEERSEQMGRYRESLNNLILTDYLDFRWYVNGELHDKIRLGRPKHAGDGIRAEKGDLEKLHDLLTRFLTHQGPTISNSEKLAEHMAALARMLRDVLKEAFLKEQDSGALHDQLRAFQTTLIPDLSVKQFADMYAQTITYGLFAARIRVKEGEIFSREKAAWNLPKTNPFLRKLFHEIAGPDLDERIAWLVDDIAHLLARADIHAVLQDFGKATRQEDPVVHFYETFLRIYDPDMRQRRGVYYTPEPVVSYIVRSLDHLLKTRFDKPDGLADRNTLILDPAVGTATFLYFVIQHVYEALDEMGMAGMWENYVQDQLLPRLFGFELLMAPYAVAHMKLGLQLQDLGYHFQGDQRLGVYLTNTLGKPLFQEEAAPFARYITEEANAAAEIKEDAPIMIILGNPPYSVSSANKGEYIERLMQRYKRAVRDERNIQPLSDDYIKFLRFAHHRINQTGHGLIGMITNHSYLSGLIHRGMRQELLNDFDELYILNLHGNALMGETAPDGGVDKNVFDIRQGVAILLAVKLPSPGGEGLGVRAHYADLWGRREDKYQALLAQDVSTTAWQELTPTEPYYFLVPKDFDLYREYQKGWSVADIFPVHSSGIKTHRDDFVIDFNEDKLRKRIAAFRDTKLDDDDLAQRYDLNDTNSWSLTKARRDLQEQNNWDSNFTKCLYRPFDIRSIYYSVDMVDRPRYDVMKHMLADNLGLLAMRQVVGAPYAHFIVTNFFTDNRTFFSNRGTPVLFPLYLYNTPAKQKKRSGSSGSFTMSMFEDQEPYKTRRPNLSLKFIAYTKERLGLGFVSEGIGDLEKNFGPEDIFHYTYAVFHSPTYRERYAEFLKIDFPRLPITSDLALFRALAKKGRELVSLHLMEAEILQQTGVRFDIDGTNQVISRHPRYLPPGDPDPESGKTLEKGRVYINDEQYFEGVEPEVWEFQMGGYQVLDKWLKDRKRAKRALDFDDVRHYSRVVVALRETIRLMTEIDEIIPDWPLA